MLILDNQMLDELCQQAEKSPRRRQHFNIHASYEENCQRLFNALQPNSYIPPHKHSLTNKKELLVAIRGAFSLITFDDWGDLVQTVYFGTEKYSGDLCPNVGIEIPSDTWHTVIARQDNSILLEVKEGPFISDEAKEIALWAPRDNLAEVELFLAKCHEFSDSNPSSGQ